MYIVSISYLSYLFEILHMRQENCGDGRKEDYFGMMKREKSPLPQRNRRGSNEEFCYTLV